MKAKLRFEANDYLVLFLLSIGAIISIFGVYTGLKEIIKIISRSLSNLYW